MKKILIASILLISQLSWAQFTNFNTIKEVQVKNKGVVVSAHPLASEAGAAILRMGGNAYDAITATQYALAVVYPQAGNIGGGGFLVGVKNNGEKFTLDYRETAPKKASRDMYIDKKGKADTDLSQNGRLAVGIPGSVAGFFATLKHCKLPMEKIIQPAIDLAEKGFAITDKEAEMLNSQREKFQKHNRSSIIFVKDAPWKAGDLLIQKDLAETLKLIQKLGAKGFYEGKTADLLVAEMKRGNGIITLEDLKNYKVAERKALEFDYKGNDVVTMPLPSSGGVLLAQMLRMASFENLEKYQQNSTKAVQIMTEAERRAFADRAEYMGDPDFIQDKTSYLISDEYLKGRWKNFSFDKATPSSEVGKIIAQPNESMQTTHISVLDKDGNAASVTTTLNGYYGSKVLVSGAGFFLNNEMDDFSIKPGVPNMFGAVGGEANAIQPNKRMLSSMTPTIILKNGKPFMVVGTPGGTTIPTSVYQSIVNVVDFKLNANISVNAPKFHHQWLPETITVENNFPESTITELKSKNYVIEKTKYIGKTEMIVLDDKGNIHAVADGRGDDSVAVE
ncbi:gamma-glutamyltransferase [Chryseobacterium indologenes]|uniref:gamma-glutamyltransferase n=1 Tax=Chryseobacterium indologenes TaxID=253 RepID=UPI000B51C001|nr:gamma-glutamyltransferase [Chryseobacterium indologenes]ASE60421.1 gamma-glutamyltransferase [Chryseobacterium indologenes]ATN04606.1 gamma-glutamyltransferase [Chryseobacterium indologenes]AYY86642.1 gamma-glutamyltransferase [Chryseobacterium indologenes]QIX83542.1 gamma-glutamyltransferase [Chryseobacterium indologenes]UDQ53243.1 gamma-glutamyltransferase [Chryseobacterium indologenes]